MSKRSTSVLGGGGMAVSAFGLAGGIAPRPGAGSCARAITGARVINGTRAGARLTTGTGITATTGKVRQAKLVRRARTWGPAAWAQSAAPRRGRLGPS